MSSLPLDGAVKLSSSAHHLPPPALLLRHGLRRGFFEGSLTYSVTVSQQWSSFFVCVAVFPNILLRHIVSHSLHTVICHWQGLFVINCTVTIQTLCLTSQLQNVRMKLSCDRIGSASWVFWHRTFNVDYTTFEVHLGSIALSFSCVIYGFVPTMIFHELLTLPWGWQIQLDCANLVRRPKSC